MKVPGLNVAPVPFSAPLPIWHGQVTPEEWLSVARAIREAGGRLLAMWAGPPAHDASAGPPGTMCVAYAMSDGAVWLSLPLGEKQEQSVYPDLAPIFPAASRMQRAAADLSGVHAEGARDWRPWLSHGVWPLDHPPLQGGSHERPGPGPEVPPPDYSFVVVQGDGVHEIPVGPVHAGIIEPGHFRFSVVGEKVLRLEQHLGYTHKGVERRMTQWPPLQAFRLAGRVSGDTTVAYAWAYCMALESAARTQITSRAAWIRALMLERERVANHLGDLGALGNDAAFAFGLAQFSRLREDWLRMSQAIFGHRLMMDGVLPGGVGRDIDVASGERMRLQCDQVENEVRTLQGIYETHAGLQDRFMSTGRVPPSLAAHLGLTGLAGRASGQARDLRCDFSWAPYAGFGVATAVQTSGDVAARVAVRFAEVFESLRLIRSLLAGMPSGPVRAEVTLPCEETCGAGWVEGWRGELFVALDLGMVDDELRIRRCHLHDPSWQNWPVLEHAILGNIVPDFPLINKSFNLSYSGHDL